MSNIFPIDFEEKLTMAQDDYILFSDSEDGNKIKKAQYKNLKGEPGTPGTPGKDGEDGAAATITVGSTTTGAAGSSASVTNSGTSSAAILDFTIPQGAKGEPGEDGQDGADGAAATITIGTTTTLPAGSSATVTNVGTSQDAILNFGIPKGDSGSGSGDVNGPASSTDGDVALFDGATGKLIKDSGVSLADYQEKLTAGTNIQIQNNVISATGGSDIVYATQAEYNALLPGALTDGKHYFIYTGNSRLPNTFQEVEYIQSSGTQYFIVGTSFKTSYKSVIDFQMTQTGGDQIIMGLALTPYRYGINAYASNFKVITGSTGGWSNTISEDTDRHTIIIDKSTATVDSNNYTISGYTDVTVNGGIGVFALNDDGEGNYFASVKIYNLEIYDENGVLIYHLLPCYRKSDSVIGMYDLVGETFYTNSGTGTFTKGPNV